MERSKESTWQNAWDGSKILKINANCTTLYHYYADKWIPLAIHGGSNPSIM